LGIGVNTAFLTVIRSAESDQPLYLTALPDYDGRCFRKLQARDAHGRLIEEAVGAINLLLQDAELPLNRFRGFTQQHLQITGTVLESAERLAQLMHQPGK
jgi:hypothetical protein